MEYATPLDFENNNASPKQNLVVFVDGRSCKSTLIQCENSYVLLLAVGTFTSWH